MSPADPQELSLEHRLSNAETSLYWMKWLLSAGITAFILISTLAWTESRAAKHTAEKELSTQAQVRFAVMSEQYMQMRCDIGKLDAQIQKNFKETNEQADRRFQLIMTRLRPANLEDWEK